MYTHTSLPKSIIPINFIPKYYSKPLPFSSPSSLLSYRHSSFLTVRPVAQWICLLLVFSFRFIFQTDTRSMRVECKCTCSFLFGILWWPLPGPGLTFLSELALSTCHHHTYLKLQEPQWGWFEPYEFAPLANYFMLVLSVVACSQK